MKSTLPTPPLQLTLEKPVYGGDCLTHLPAEGNKPGKAVFVPLTLPGETVLARIAEDKRTFLKAEPVQILTPSPNRVTPPCDHFGPCGGCHYQHADYPTQLALKQQILRETLTRANVPIPSEISTLAAQPEHYRNRIRLALTPAGDVAYRSRSTHNLVPIHHCTIATPILIETARRLATVLSNSAQEIPVSELELFTDRDQTQLQITLYCQNPPRQDPLEWLEQLNRDIPGKTSLRLVHEDGSLTPRVLAQSGELALIYQAARFDYRVDPGAFFQVNRWLIDRFVALVTDHQAGQSAWDLYAGVGLFARALATRFAQVTAVESAPASSAALSQNLSETTATPVISTTLDYLRRNRENREPSPVLIVLDPPRAGLGDQVTTLLNAVGAPRITYVSCDPTTLARDLRALTQERYRIEKITLVDMFPHTFHIETVVELTRS